MWLIPGIITASLLAGMGDQVNFETEDETVTQIGYNTTNTNQIILNNTITTQTTNQVFLINPVWSIIHYMIFVSLLVYVLIQMLTLLTKIN